MVKHIVMFKLTGTPEERKSVATSFKNALLELPQQISVLRSMEVGINENPAETWDVVLTAIVDTLADVDIYAKHPAHVAAASLLAGHRESRACVGDEVWPPGAPRPPTASFIQMYLRGGPPPPTLSPANPV